MMLTIKRTCANKIITRVLTVGDQPFTAILSCDADDCVVADDSQSMQELLPQNPDAIVVYNQHPQAKADLDALDLDEQQIVIEVRQETRGVLGLQARYYKSNPEQFIELVYQENS